MKESSHNDSERLSLKKDEESKRVENKVEGQFTEVKNANAAGLGAIGKNDERLEEDENSPGPIDDIGY